MPYNSVTNLIGPYVIPAIDVQVFWCLTNKVPTSSTRGAGRPQGTFVIERMLDLIANKLGLDRADVRRRNIIPAEKMPYSIPIKMRDGNPMTYDSGDYPESQRQALQAADWDGFSARREASLQEKQRLRDAAPSKALPSASVLPARSLSPRARHPRDRAPRRRWRRSWRTFCMWTLTR